MRDEQFEFSLELTRRATGEPLGRAAVNTDWTPIEEHLALKLVRDGKLPDFNTPVNVALEPIWSGDGPAVKAVRATGSASGAKSASTVVTLDYFRPLAQQAANRLVEVGRLRSGELFEYRVLAKPRAIIAQSTRRRIVIERGSGPVNILPGRIDDLAGDAILLGAAREHDVPAFVNWRALEQASVLTRQAGELETGGILIGHVRRDDASGEIFIQITDQIAARARSQLTRLSFTAQTWSQLEQEVDRRGRGEVWLGWWHSHSFYKKEMASEEETSPTRFLRPFLSEEDCLLHRSVFPRAYSVALLMTDSPRSGMSWTMFGWRCGTLAQRGFHVTGMPMPQAFFSLRGESHAKI